MMQKKKRGCGLVRRSLQMPGAPRFSISRLLGPPPLCRGEMNGSDSLDARFSPRIAPPGPTSPTKRWVSRSGMRLAQPHAFGSPRICWALGGLDT